MCALEFEYQLVLGLGNSDSSSTLAKEIMLTHECAPQNFGVHFQLEEMEDVAFPMCLDCMYNPAWCMNFSAFFQISLTISTISIELL